MDEIAIHRIGQEDEGYQLGAHRVVLEVGVGDLDHEDEVGRVQQEEHELDDVFGRLGGDVEEVGRHEEPEVASWVEAGALQARDPIVARLAGDDAPCLGDVGRVIYALPVVDL